MSSERGPVKTGHKGRTKPDPEKEETPTLDAVIKQIETDLVVVHRVVRQANGAAQTPLNGVRFKEARAIFRRMAECPIMSDSGEDIEIDTPCKEDEEPPSNGAKP